MKQLLDWNAYLDTAVQAVAEGIVMLKNENNVLPLATATEVALFGRMQFHYFKSGTGSGGMVNVHRVVGIREGLMEAGILLNPDLTEIYTAWEAENPTTKADGWGGEAWSQPEMPLTDEIAEMAAKSTDTAICIIARTAGEEQDNFDDEGSYRLTQTEIDMLKTVRRHFAKMIVLLNVGNIIDMSDIEAVKPDAILYIWQGGMMGGNGTAAVLTGKISPCGKLPDTIAYQLSDYPSDANFGDLKRNFYSEDIYVGYRYFETVAKDKVRYPFGFGLSYTTFSVVPVIASLKDGVVSVEAKVTNTGDFSGKEVVQVYCEAPQGRLGKPARVLCGFRKTALLEPSETEIVRISFDMSVCASYDDSGVTSCKDCFLLEKGDYLFFVGSDVRSATECMTVNIWENMPQKVCHSAMAPVLPFARMKPVAGDTGMRMEKESVPLMIYDEEKRRIDALPEEIPMTGNCGIKLADVRDGKASMRNFIAQLDEDDLCCLVRGEGMGSPKATAGTAAVFGGITEKLAMLGIPCACCDDGPSGLRLDSGKKVASLPIGTMLAATFNPELIEQLYTYTGLEMTENNIDILLGPGMNIHRHPRNGRNFEYFSEDPLLTGKMGAAILRGLQTSGVTGTIKHFCGNNQESNRHYTENCISVRALREIYLRGFEIAVKEGSADSVMTTYGSVNGQWTAGSYDLNTVILRDEWRFSGFTMTDWWANINQRGQEPDKSNLAAMVRAQNDIYMVCPDTTMAQGNLHTALQDGTLTIAELQRNAMNLCGFLMHTNAMKRLCSEEFEIEVQNRPQDTEDDGYPIMYYPVDKDFSFPIDALQPTDGKRHAFVFYLQNLGKYELSVTASTESDHAGFETVVLGSHVATFRFGKEESTQAANLRLFSDYTITRLHFFGEGLQLKEIRLHFVSEEKFN